ncbi:bifunctional tRNA (5-methylaminomethyl-2-thiouridine)(34)-methyltransferase MnmD/FAD-dependent 5-carboxymethylaminomethyl-2-thiouridine(34) oxidoreductase MnmC [Microbulbifer sp. SH-1]|uniref:bifunctional tRNA (5-methylaminomethyl-2-thiouridine)(34)-methyltransferase MnmD/FAD-dependent 5-carboxymethylaminomethyl-2-thiouridine(34) oxidoreductase MnmC n=1 Tax=Microbulbifer sp. SH-1 TaxID=2681547 RepID=UPI00140B7DA8|nr:bifunctional tRNA (5-methylaminomethyl-2-thiouridine)(34)-methyltransferase MnmD/FAD-dependent 5-carboxymethylaminomethyl-2-thiouridine(34) oxidoreductase MnmC [Microbulbifer sp. SH-1]QIL88826.1 bifunctional tRNA (5-methylaminomethyl-2-thiouridine)(34)-methyltransferase MnmD/FAD-dependent 5-carboxymethylaminomethyl-2-thiouridine(34) oxidoreductase MnmC [Microbulbifer sp. SH-1]
MSEQQHTPVILAQLEWKEDGQPVSSAFDDIYFSTASGLEETRHVFLKHNHLSERWANLADNATFSIGETGFGTGLNFLAAWQLWRQTAPATAQLHFVSVEKFPLAPHDLRRALALWPELRELSEQLIAQYPTYLASGVHRLNFAGNVHLTLIIDEASRGFERIQLDDPHRDSLVNAWFLDGFAPAKNPEMWSDDLFRAIAQLSAQESTLATFTCAGIVKRGLKAVGFALEKVPGFGRKREMLRGRFSAATPAEQGPHRTTPWHLPVTNTEPPATIAVIGAGIAGATAARALADRNFQVAVFEQGNEPGSGASGNDQGILYAKLSPKPGPNGDFNLLALQFAQRFYRSHCPDAIHFDGLLQLAETEKEQQLQQQVIDHLELDSNSLLAQPVSAPQASELAGVDLNIPGLYFPEAGWLRPKQVCSTLLNHPNIHFHPETPVLGIQQTAARWELETENRGKKTSHQFDAIILCSANFNRQFPNTAPLPLQPIRGQVSFARATPVSQALNIALCGEGYIAPAAPVSEPDKTPQHSFGATFKLKQTDLEIREEEHQENLATLASLLPQIAESLSHQQLRGRTALRAATPDYLPMAGPVAEWAQLENTYGALRKNRKQRIDRRTPYQQNLYVLAGLGSRGFTYAPLAAEVLAAWISKEVMPVSEDLVKALHPMRFAIRNLGKNKAPH